MIDQRVIRGLICDHCNQAHTLQSVSWMLDSGLGAIGLLRRAAADDGWTRRGNPDSPAMLDLCRKCSRPKTEAKRPPGATKA